eukprot:364734-Chlamydomonas_euryale.AAC.9
MSNTGRSPHQECAPLSGMRVDKHRANLPSLPILSPCSGRLCVRLGRKTQSVCMPSLHPRLRQTSWQT